MDGTYETTDIETREPPQTWNAWRDMTLVFRTSLLMCIHANSQHTLLAITKQELDSFYDWLEGPEFGNHPTHRVPLTKLRAAEREAWRRICLKVHERMSLRSALEAVRRDYLFWTPILMGDPGAGFSATGEPRGKGKGSRWGRGKGRGGKPAKSRGKSKGQETWQRPQGKAKGKWAKQDSWNREFCWAYNKGSCRGGCNRSHRCCKTLRSGWPCNGRHPAVSCKGS